MPKTDSASFPPLDWSTFAGLHAPQATQVSDELLDWVMAYLTGAELKVLLYIVRRTFGFKKEADAISLDQLCHGIVRRDGRRLDLGTGLKRPTVLEALRSLRAKNLITAVQVLGPATGSRPTVYALKLQRGDAPDDRPTTQEGGMPEHRSMRREGYARTYPGPYAKADPRGMVEQPHNKQFEQQTEKDKKTDRRIRKHHRLLCNGMATTRTVGRPCAPLSMRCGYLLTRGRAPTKRPMALMPVGAT